MGGWPVVKLPSGYYANPIDKAFKRVDNGPEDSVVSFWAAVVPTSSGNPAGGSGGVEHWIRLPDRGL